MAVINTSFAQLVAAFFVAFLLAHVTTKYFERFERFPSPLVQPGPGVPASVQGRDYIPHRFKPSPPPGPDTPLAVESDPSAYGPVPRQPQAKPLATRAPKLLYPMTSDDYLSFVSPEYTMDMSTIAPNPAGQKA